MNSIRIIDQHLLDDLSKQAAASRRLRKNLNFHESDEDACHRLLNAMEPGTYIQPHHHAAEGKDETVTILRGKLGLIEFDDSGRVTGTVRLEPGGENVAVHIPRGTIHAWVALEPGSIFIEAKAGPYRPFTPEERAAWAPAEGDPGATDYMNTLVELFNK